MTEDVKVGRCKFVENLNLGKYNKPERRVLYSRLVSVVLAWFRVE